MKKNWLAITAISAVALCLFGCLGIGLATRFAPDLYQFWLENSSLQVGDTAPDFELQTLDGQRIRLSQFSGQPVLLSFGASWCPDCKVEAPLLQKLHVSHPDLKLLVIDSREAQEPVQNFVTEFGLTFPVLLDLDGSVAKQYQIVAIPTELFIDKDGVIRAKLIEKITTQLLAEKLPLISVVP